MRIVIPLIHLLAIAVDSALADPPPEDFLGIKWGASIPEARALLEQRKGLTPDHKATSSEQLRFTGGTFAGFDVDAWELSFGPKGFFHAVVLVRDSAGGDAFRAVKQAISEKYGGGRVEAMGTRTRHFDSILQQWVNGDATKPRRTCLGNLRPRSRQTIRIQCSPEKEKRARVAYLNETLAKDSSNTAPAKNTQPKKADL